MAERIEVREVTVPAGTSSASPLDTSIDFNLGDVERIEVIVPPGPSGLMGFQILSSDEPVIPYRGTAFIITDNERISWPVAGFPTSGRWAVRAYNEDVHDHVIYLRFLVTEVNRTEPLDTQPLSIWQPNQQAQSIEDTEGE